ncbi:MAG: MFS transporter [Microbacteriaceae bacterium]
MNFSTRKSWAMIVFLWLCGVFAAVQIAKVSVIFQDYSAYLGADTAGNALQAGLLIGAVSIVPMVLGFLSGPIFQRMGYRNVLLASLLLGSLCSLHQAFDTDLTRILLSRVFEGFSMLGIVVVAPILITQISSAKIISLSMSLWATFFGFAFAISGWAAPVLIAIGGYPLVFAAHAGVLVLLAVLTVFIIPNAVNGADNKLQDAEQASKIGEVVRELLQDVARSIRKYAVLAPGVVFLAHTLLYTPILTFLPPFISDGRNLGTLVFELSMVSILGTIVSGPLAQYLLNPIRTMFLGFLGMVAALIALLALPGLDAGASYTLALLLLFFSGMIQGTVFSSIGYVNTSEYDRVVSNSTTVQLGNIGSTFGPMIFALVVVSGYAPLLWGFVLLTVLGLVAVLFVRTPKKARAV